MIDCFPRRAVFGVLTMVTAQLASCAPPDQPPPPTLIFDGLPVSGRWDDARKAGFTSCADVTRAELRCRRSGVMFQDHGPFNAAISLHGSNGRSGFDQLTLWHDQDQNALVAVVEGLERRGWRHCFTGEGSRGDQGIYSHPSAPVRISLDLSYSGKRRLRILPLWNKLERQC